MLDDFAPDVAVVDGYFKLHDAIASMALQRDIFVISEKPLALTLPRLKTAGNCGQCFFRKDIYAAHIALRTCLLYCPCPGRFGRGGDGAADGRPQVL